MRVRVTIARAIEQYTDVLIPEQESLELATEYVEAQLKHPVTRARLLRGATWFGDKEVGDAVVVEAIPADQSSKG